MKQSQNEPCSFDPETDGMMLRPVGIIRNKIENPILAAVDDGIRLQGEMEETRTRIREMHQDISRIVVNEDLIHILDGIEDFSHLVVLYWAHRVPEKNRLLKKVHPMGRPELPLVGIFCTCSPVRPNPVLMTVVRLCGREGNVLEVSGLDAVNGSPVIDIKPYVKTLYPQGDVLISAWMQQIVDEMEEIEPR